MPDPRLATNTRVGTEPTRRLTFAIDGTDIVYSDTAVGGSTVTGRAVMLSGAGIVRLTGAGSAVLGKLLVVEKDGTCTVEMGGVVELPKGDGAVAVGDRIVGDVLATVRGYIRGVVAATLADVAAGGHRVLNAATTTAIEVALGA